MRKMYTIKLIALIMLLSLVRYAQAQEAPYLAPIPDQTATMSELFTYDVDAVYADPAEIYELLESRPGMSINSSTGQISWIPSQPGDGGVVTVRAYNNVGESVRSFFVYIADAIVCNPDLNSYWKLDDATSTTFADYKSGNTATSVTPLRDTTGQVGRAKVFDPSTKATQFLSVPDNGQYDFISTAGITISLWFNYRGQFTQDLVNQVLVGRGNPSTAAAEVCWLLMIDAESNPAAPRVAFSIRPRSTESLQTVNSNVVINPNQWYHVVATYNGASKLVSLYVDNVKRSISVPFGNENFFGFGNYDLDIGYWNTYPTNRYPFNGAMDEVFIYMRAFTDSEVNEAYTDGLNGQAHCKPGNYFPLITSTPVDTATEEQPYSYTLQANDYDGGILTLSAEIIPDFLNFNQTTGELSGTPSDDDVGDHQVRLKATDGQVDIFQNFTLHVINVNDSPEITSTPAASVNEGTAYSYLVQATDPDGDVLSYRAEILPTWLSFDTVTHILLGIPQRADAGDNPVKITVSDGEFQVSQEFNINVVSGNNIPVITSTPQSIVDNYSEYTYTMSAFDADASDVLTFGAETVPSWLTFDPTSAVLSGIPANTDVGEHQVSLFVSDGYVQVDQVFTITVRAVNTAPVVISEPGDTAKVGLLYTYLMEVVDYQGDVVSFSPTLVPDWLTFDVGSRVLSGTPTSDELGQHTVIITISDGVFTVNHQFVITVAPRWGVGVDPSAVLMTNMYPNPAENHVILEFAGNPNLLEITDLTGKIQLVQPINSGIRNLQLDVSGLESGIYFVRVHEGKNEQISKLIIK